MKPLLRRVVLGALCLPRALTAQTPVRFSVQEIATLPQAASAQPLIVFHESRSLL